MQQDIHIVALINVEIEHRDKFLGIMEKLTALGKASEGNKRYELMQDIADPASFTLVAQWRSAEDIHNYMAIPEIADLVRLFSSGNGAILPIQAKKIF
jgi:quinol monooxygenase YgiN